jgi:FtsZ-binding cell division protein ZapB
MSDRFAGIETLEIQGHYYIPYTAHLELVKSLQQELAEAKEKIDTLNGNCESIAEQCEEFEKENQQLREALIDVVNQATRQGGIGDYVLDPMGLSAYEDALALLNILGKVVPIPPHNYQYKWVEGREQ